MSLPKQVKVGGHVYEVRQVSEDIGCSGEIDYRADIIRISTKDLSPANNAETLWHEVIHAIGYDRNLKGFFGTDVNEELVDALAHGLNAFMVDNGLTFPEGD